MYKYYIFTYILSNKKNKKKRAPNIYFWMSLIKGSKDDLLV